ncbi:MAG: polysaccharide pyruvyl transferase family protein [Desulfuromonadales bacterium]
MHLLLIGYLGANNLGDECMLRQFLMLFEPYRNVSFTILSYGANYDSDRITTYRIPFAPETRRQEYAKVLSGVDAVIWVGGTCFTDFDGDGAFGMLIRARLLRKKFYYCGVATDRLTSAARMLKAVLAMHLCHGIIFRDQFSLNFSKRWLVSDHKVSVGEDLGTLYLSEQRRKYACDAQNIVVSWRELKKNVGDATQSGMIELLAIFLVEFSRRQDKPLVIFNTDEFMDKDVHDALIRNLQRQEFSNYRYYEDTCLDEKLELISRAYCVITARLHTAVAAHVLGKPAVVCNYSQKIIEFAAGKPSVMMLSLSMIELKDVDRFLATVQDGITGNIRNETESVYTRFAQSLYNPD